MQTERHENAGADVSTNWSWQRLCICTKMYSTILLRVTISFFNKYMYNYNVLNNLGQKRNF